MSRAPQSTAPEVARPAHRPLSGPELCARVLAMEVFLVALAASEIKTRPDPKAYVQKLKSDAIEGVLKFGHPEATVRAQEFVDELIEAILTEADMDLSGEG